MPDLCSVWISAFPEDKATFARALLDNDYSVTGIAQWTQTDPESLVSGNRDILLISPEITDKEGNVKDHIAEGVMINTKNIKILELKTAELDNEGGKTSWLKRITRRSKM